jgi:putative transposase
MFSIVRRSSWSSVAPRDRKPILATPEVHAHLRAVWAAADAWRVGRYVLMPDHLHLFCVPGSLEPPPLAKWMAFWKSQASRQWPNPADQPVWQKDFWDTQIRDSAHFAEKWEYVRRNPCGTGFVRAPRSGRSKGDSFRHVA